MKTIKVSEATNTQLDWLVAKCLYVDEYDSKRVFLHCTGHEGAQHYVRIANQETCEVHMSFEWHPSTNWSQMGPIIEREMINLRVGYAVQWKAFTETPAGFVNKSSLGGNALIAAARCFVASRLGDTVEIPEELT